MTEGVASQRAPSVLPAAALVGLWAAGAWQAQTFGIWPAVGTTAVVLGLVGLWVDGPALLERLRPDRSALVAGLVVGVLMTVATYVAYPILEGFLPAMRGEVVRLYEAFGSPGLGVILVVLPIVVLCEEIVWRGVVYEALASRFSVPVVIASGSLIYALAHAPIGAMALSLACICVGICWNGLRWWTNSLAAVTVAHIVWDVSVLIVWPLVPVG